MDSDVNQAQQEGEYRRTLSRAGSEREVFTQARTFRRSFKTKARPVQVKCADGQEYMVKGQQAGRQIINDQIVARLGMMLGAPVGKPQLIDIPTELIEIEPMLSHMTAGIAHGTLIIPDCMDQIELIATSEPRNRSRLARLAVLYGWVIPGDWQFLFNQSPPRLIYSVDHGHFFPNGPNWQIEDLLNAEPPYLPECFSNCNLNDEELQEALEALSAISTEQIVQAVASPPDEWGLTINERVQLVRYLRNRQQALPAIFVTPS